ncbi:MAG: hypothetical protein N4A59_00565 [Marinifilum sp.]|jgi:hypothetical protein|nr:hypothetical protein [Marinifilum sp.]
MCNRITVFTTKREGHYGSSLYLITPDWILRCSGNKRGGRVAETFARKRSIIYKNPGAVFTFPALGLTPEEGGHTGNAITAVLNDTGEIPNEAPDNWNYIDGVSWQKAIQEIKDAKAALHTEVAEIGRFSRKVGTTTFNKD